MESSDLELIEELILENQELSTLWKQHLAYERQLEEMNSRLYLTPEEQLERKRIQKLKLSGRDRIENILAEYKAKA